MLFEFYSSRSSLHDFLCESPPCIAVGVSLPLSLCLKEIIFWYFQIQLNLKVET